VRDCAQPAEEGASHEEVAPIDMLGQMVEEERQHCGNAYQITALPKIREVLDDSKD